MKENQGTLQSIGVTSPSRWCVYLDSAEDFCYFFWRLDVTKRWTDHIESFSLVIGGVLGYFLGSVPTAYLLVKWKSNIDIRTAGSRNVGTLNSFEVSRSRLVGGAVLLVDFLKGMVAVGLSGFLFEHDFGAMACAGWGAVVGHNFPVWLGFKGGRGLATAAGVMMSVCSPAVAVWVVAWFIGFSFWRKVNLGNVFATAVLFVSLFLVPDDIVRSVAPKEATIWSFRLFGSLLLFIILIKHIDPLREHFFMDRTKELP